ncbi:MAG: hypothetical protein ACKO24_00640 [Leptolyngbyaceae cyanobacterium]
MDNLAERYVRLSRAYIKLADKFHKLDVEHMALRGKVVPLLRAVKAHRVTIDQLSEENLALKAQLTELAGTHQRIQILEAQLQSLTAQYHTLQPLEALLQSEVQETLTEAEQQIELVEATVDEMDNDRDPDLSEADKQLLQEYENDPSRFTLPPQRYPVVTHAETIVQTVMS